MNAEKTMADVSKFARILLVDTAVHVSLVMNSDRTTKTVKVRESERGEESNPRSKITYTYPIIYNIKRTQGWSSTKVI